MGTSDLANRMKKYKKRNQYCLQKRTPVAIRVDGRSFNDHHARNRKIYVRKYSRCKICICSVR